MMTTDNDADNDVFFMSGQRAEYANRKDLLKPTRRHGLAAIAISPPPLAGGNRHCSAAANGWRAATHAHLAPTHTRALPETF